MSYPHFINEEAEGSEAPDQVTWLAHVSKERPRSMLLGPRLERAAGAQAQEHATSSVCEQGKEQERAAGTQAGAGLCVGCCAFLASANFSKKLS